MNAKPIIRQEGEGMNAIALGRESAAGWVGGFIIMVGYSYEVTKSKSVHLVCYVEQWFALDGDWFWPDMGIE